jgi:hypothetical protein
LPQVANLRYRIAAALVAAGWQPALLQRRRPSPQVANLRYRIAAAPVAQVFNLRHHTAPVAAGWQPAVLPDPFHVKHGTLGCLRALRSLRKLGGFT